MGLLRLVLLAALSLAHAKDPRICAIRSKNLEQLQEICSKASIDFPADADAETLRAMLYQRMQEELPESVRPKGTPLQAWPGPGEPGECDDPAATAAAKAAAAKSAPSLEQVAASLFSRLDTDHDGQLTRSEMQAMIDSVNAAARAKGEPEHDLFATLDRDKDGKVSRSEADETFKAMASAQQGQAGGKRAAPSGQQAGGNMADGLFKGLDTNKDGKLSKAEMQSILDQYAAEAKAKGEEGEDFWSSLDADSDGFVDMKEAEGFFAAMTAALKGSKKDEV